MPSSRLPQRPLDPQAGDREANAQDGSDGRSEPQSGKGPGGPGPAAPPPRPDLIDVLATLVSFVGAGLVVGLLSGWVGLGDVGLSALAWVTPLVLALQSLVFLIAFLALVWQGRGLSLRDVGLGPMPPGWLRRGVLWGLAVIPAAMVVNLLTFVALGTQEANPQVEMLAPAGPSLIGFLLVLPLAAVLVPFVEELAFRGVLYGWLRAKLPLGGAMLVSAGVFSVAHGIPQLIPALAVVGYFLARLREREDSVWPCIAMHGTFNGVMTVVLFAALSAGAEAPTAV
jgi:hypothetical protein